MNYQRLISNAERAYYNAQTTWAKEYWLGVMQALLKKTTTH